MHRVVVALGLLSLVGCQSLLGFEEFEAQGAGAASGGTSSGGSGGTPSGGSGGVAAAAGTAGCEHLDAPSGMVGVRMAGDECVWVDETEVDHGSYALFLQALQTGDPSAYTHQTACTWKSTHEDFAPACPTDAGAGAGADDLPVTCVDWCDAWAYCAYDKKRLCEKDYWQQACRSGGPQHNYPYGGSYDSEACNGADNTQLGCTAGCKLAPAGDQTLCVTPNGISDLSGNASEWTDACAGYSSEAQLCPVQGGSVAQQGVALQCTSSLSSARNSRNPFLGFRCCWLPP